jgi:hypothetical protein
MITEDYASRQRRGREVGPLSLCRLSGLRALWRGVAGRGCYHFPPFCYHFAPVEAVHRSLGALPEPSAIGPDRQFDAGVTELLLHVGRRNAVGQEQRGERVAEAVG